MQKVYFSLVCFLTSISIFASNNVDFKVSGIENNDTIYAYISSDSYLKRLILTTDGVFTFTDVPTGTYSLKLESNGYNLPQSKTVIVNEDGSIYPSQTINLTVTRVSDNPNEWTHHWEDDGSISGYVTTAHINVAPALEYLGKKIVPSDVSYSSSLYARYKIILSNEQSPWSEEYAYRLNETLKTIPADLPSTWPSKIKKFILTSEHLADDIMIVETSDSTQEVTIAEDAFYYANPFLVNLDGVRGRFFSKRLHHAIVKLITDYGRDKETANAILERRFGCSINVPNYEDLTRDITNEDASCFQDFIPSELVAIINMLEELPEGYHVTPHLNYLIRRQNGHKHPLYPSAAAVAWTVDNGYIEFMESTFNGNNEAFETQRLILHEKTHFLWEFSFSQGIKEDWIKLGGWYQDPNNPEGWSTTKDVEFVTEYAHGKNPDEDMAESVAFYLKNPDKLLSRSPEKYEFIRDRIMHGTRYISKIREDLTFEVLNLFPDYDYPGKIKRLDIKVEGAPDEDKLVVIEVELNHIEGLQDGASTAITRISTSKASEMGMEQFYDIWLGQVEGNPHILRGEVLIDKHSRTDFWLSTGVNIYDEQGNTRMTSSNDIAWNLYIYNPLEDIEIPCYHPGTLAYEVTDTILDNGKHALNWMITCKVTDNIGLLNGMIRIGCEKFYSWNDLYGEYNEETQTFVFNYIVPDYYKEADYYVEFLSITDFARNNVSINFSDSPLHQPRLYQTIKTPNPDYDAPELDLNRIYVYAEPTNTEAPDGETLVTINFYARDNNAGLGRTGYSLLDPQGIEHGDWYYHRNFYTMYFDGDPTVWEKYTIKTILPQGSAPGIWGLYSVSLEDKALNGKTYNFVETCIFEPDDSDTDYVLFAELNQDNTHMSLSLSSETFDIAKYQYRIIHDDSGFEISGVIENGVLHAKAMMGAQNTGVNNVDVSSLPDGNLIVIMTAMDYNGKALSVKSKTMEKLTNTTDCINSSITADTHSVFTINGIKISDNIDIQQLQSGLYIIDGQIINVQK